MILTIFFSSQTAISTSDLLDLINPAAILKDANSLAHDLMLGDLWLAIVILKELDLTNGEQWEHLAVLVTDDEAVDSWQSNFQQVKGICKEKRDR